MNRYCAPVCQTCAQLIEANKPTSLRTRIDNQHREIIGNTTDRKNDQTQTQDVTPFGEAQEIPLGPVGEEAMQTLQNMQVYMQQTVLAKEEYGHVKDHCKCNDRRCAVWATEGKYEDHCWLAGYCCHFFISTCVLSHSCGALAL